MDDTLNIFDTCHGCGSDAVRARMRVGYGDCCDPETRGVALSESRADGIQREAAGVS